MHPTNDRRSFLKQTAILSTVSLLSPSVVFASAANSAVRIGVIGCGNRGSSVISAMSRHTPIHIMAIADLFQDKLDAAKDRYSKLNQEKGLPALQATKVYRGANAYKQMLEDKDIDAVLIASPAYTHPAFIEASITAEKHFYCEKPVAMDVAGCKRVIAASKNMQSKLSGVIGFQIRKATPYVQLMERIHQGAIGEVVNAQLYYFSSGLPVVQSPDMSYDEVRIRNQFFFRDLSGGILLDQGVHMLDVCNWALGAHPGSAIGTGSMRGASEFGDTYKNYQVIYQYPGDTSVSFHSTQFGGTFGDVCARFIGTDGIAVAQYNGGVYINGKNSWDSGILRESTSKESREQQAAGVFTSSLYDSTENKVKSFIDSIVNKHYLNELEEASFSTLTAVLGRQAAIGKRQVYWDEMLTQNEHIDPRLNLEQFI